MSQSGRPFCYAPWSSVTLSPDGSTGPCCMIPDGYTKEGASSVDLYGLNNSTAVQMRKALSAPYSVESLPEGCRECFKKDALAIDSVRAQYETRLRNKEVQVSNDLVVEDDIVHLDLSLTNICNFKCRYCYSRNSSKWIAEKNLLFKVDRDFFMRNVTGNIDRVYDTDPKDFVAFVSKLRNLKTIEFKGGEPFLSKSHLAILRGLTESGQAAQLELMYTTNGTIFSQEASDLWKGFKRVYLTVSADGLDPVFKYVRSDTIPFDLVWRNFSRYRAQDSAVCNLHMTVSVFNFLYLPEFVAWLEAQNIKLGVSVGIVYSPPIWCFRMLPERHIRAVANKLKESKFQEIRNFAAALLGDASDSKDYVAKIPDFLYANGEMDRLRNKDLRTQLPEVWEAIQEQLQASGNVNYLSEADTSLIRVKSSLGAMEAQRPKSDVIPTLSK